MPLDQALRDGTYRKMNSPRAELSLEVRRSGTKKKAVKRDLTPGKI